MDQWYHSVTITIITMVTKFDYANEILKYDLQCKLQH